MYKARNDELNNIHQHFLESDLYKYSIKSFVQIEIDVRIKYLTQKILYVLDFHVEHVIYQEITKFKKDFYM